MFVGICFLGEDVRVQAAWEVRRCWSGRDARAPRTVVVRYPKKRGPKKNNLAQFPQVSSLVLDKVENEVKTCFHVKFVYIYNIYIEAFKTSFFFGRPTVVQPLMYIHLSSSAGGQSFVSHHDNWITFNLKPRHFIGFRYISLQLFFLSVALFLL